MGIFVLALLVTWAAGAWVTPVGPFVWGGYWLPFLIPGLLFLLLLVSLTPVQRPRTVQEAVDQARAETAAAETAFVVLSAFFWLLVAALLAAIVAAYV